HRVVADRALDGVDQLDLVSGARLPPVELAEDSGQQDVAAEGGQVGRRIAGRGLFDDVDDLVDPTPGATGGDDAVAADLALGHASHGQHRRARAAVRVDHLLDPARDRLLDAVLDGRLVDERQHLLRLGLGRGQKSSPQACRGEDSLTYGRERHQRQSIWWGRAKASSLASKGFWNASSTV